MDHEVHEVEQDPPAAGEALDVMRAVPLAIELLHDGFRDPADVGVRCSGRDHEEVGGVRQAPQVEYHELAPLQIDDGIQRQAQGLRDLGRHRAGPAGFRGDPSAGSDTLSIRTGLPSSTW
jgi:hypothetical protein